MPTQLERRTETRQAIVDAALSIFLDEGGIEASLDAIAERAGVAKSTVVYHFGGRVGLLDAVASSLYHEMGARLGPFDQYEDARAFVRAFLLDARLPTARIYQQVGDHLLYTVENEGWGRGLQSMIGALEMLGITDRVLVIAAATLMMARQVTFGHADEAAIDAFIDEVFAGVPVSARPRS
jgi:AcrR family transcriptional regulator